MNVSIDLQGFRVPPKRKMSLEDWPTLIKPVYKSRDDYHEILDKHINELRSLQNVLYAANRYSLLLIFQAMDAAGKDSAIKRVMSGVNPQGCQVFSFKHPSAEELDHDFLWRATRSLPERGRIGIFNRSYYEEVLIVRVHREILRAEQLPTVDLNAPGLWRHRYQSIVAFEKHLNRSGTQIIKFFLHLSKEEQRKRFLARIDDPEKNWKFSQADVEERKYWKDYMRAYEECLGATSTRHSPWYVVPADDKETAGILIARIVVQTLKAMQLRYPRVDAAHRNELRAMRKTLAK
jgi:PPK2 family polyphosphate:nucleotide phosphotransferase